MIHIVSRLAWSTSRQKNRMKLTHSDGKIPLNYERARNLPVRDLQKLICFIRRYSVAAAIQCKFVNWVPLNLRGSNLGLAERGMNLFSSWGCGIEGNLKAGCGIAMGRQEAGSWLFSWRNAGIVDFFVRGQDEIRKFQCFTHLQRLSRFGVPTNRISFFSTWFQCVLNIQKTLLISSRRLNFLQDPTSDIPF